MAFSADAYDPIRAGMIRSAATVVPDVMELVEPRTVVDVGCGPGAWLAEFARHGCAVHGYDGHSLAHLDIPEEAYTPVDLDTVPRLEFPEGVDLAVCLEVGEHLVPRRSLWLVETLCQADVVLFSAAIPSQGGLNHINEQWPGYWAERFRTNGFEVSGALRWRWWNDVPEKIEVWYAQNMLLCVRAAVLADRPKLAPLFASEMTPPHAVVHPLYWSNR